MLDLTNYFIFYEHLYDFPGNLNSFIEVLGRQLPLIAKDINLAKMELEINLPQIFCDRFPYKYSNTIFNTQQDTDPIPVYTEFITDHDGVISITAYSIKGTLWTRDQVKEIIFLNEQIMVLLTRSRLQSQLKKAEETDNITSVLNLEGIIHVGELLTIKKVLSKFSVVALNIKNFSSYNEKYGHITGDEILRNYATGISDFIGKDGVVGRTGSDNFLVVISTPKVQKLTDFLKNYQIHFELDTMEKETVTLSTRYGISDGTESSYFPQLIVNAKQAMKK